MNKKITLITGNEGKAREFERLLGFSVDRVKLDLPETQSVNVETVSSLKVSAAFDIVKSPVMVDDTGLVFSAWGNLPGALVKWFLDEVGNEGILKMLEGWTDRSAYVITSIGYADNERRFVVKGVVEGEIATEPRGANGFGYDEIFIPKGYDKTFAEMTDVEKDEVSMRSRAVEALLEKLKD